MIDYTMRLMTRRSFKPPSIAAPALGLLALALLVLTIALAPTPAINLAYGETTIAISADRAWTLFPGDCATISWDMRGIQSLHIDWGGNTGKRGEVGWGERAFCPSVGHSELTSSVRTPDGLLRELPLRIHFLPDLLLYLSGFVGFCGSLLLTAYLLFGKRMARRLSSRWLLAAALILATIGTTLRLNEPAPPLLEETDGQITARMWAEQGILVFPHECVEVEFSVAGAQTLRFNDKTVALEDGWAQRNHCDWQGGHALLEAVGEDGVTRQFRLPIPSLFGGLSHIPLYLVWALVGLLLAAFAFLPMALAKARHAWRQRQWQDFAALGCFAGLTLLLYLPFGFNTPGEWEEWVAAVYFDGRGAFFTGDFVIRFWGIVPYALARLVSSESFLGWHLAHYAALTLQVMLFYGILRQLRLRRLYAFLLAALFLAYPANDMLMSLPASLNNSSVMWLMLATYCSLDYLENPRRLTLLRAVLALLLNVFSYEAGLALIFALPLFWQWWRRPGSPRQFNLGILWNSAAVCKLAYMLLLRLTDRSFYRSELLDLQPLTAPDQLTQLLAHVLGEVLPAIYFRTFVTGWQNALAALADTAWQLPIALSLICVGALDIRLARQDKSPPPPLRPLLMALLVALACAGLAAGVLMWLPTYNQGDMLRLFYFVPGAAAAAVFCLLLLLTRKLKRGRDFALIALCLLLTLAGLARLYAQHDHYRQDARRKAAVFQQILELAPRPMPNTHLVIITRLSRQQLRQAQLDWLSFNTLTSSALRVLYAEHSPASIYFCFVPAPCSRRDLDAVAFRPDRPGEHLKDTLLLDLREDFTLAIVDDPAAYLGWDADIDYDAARLYDADAPLPPRARTMLGLLPSVPPSSRGKA